MNKHERIGYNYNKAITKFDVTGYLNSYIQTSGKIGPLKMYQYFNLFTVNFACFFLFFFLKSKLQTLIFSNLTVYR